MNLFNNFQIPPVFVTVIFVWSILWKSIALWKSVKQTKIVWFIILLVLNTIGIYELSYFFIFSKIKDVKQFIKVHDYLLIASILACFLSILSPFFLAGVVVAMGLFIISLLQETLEKKKWKWLILEIIFGPITCIIYYLLYIRNPGLKS